jgi:hypothetical protein
MESARWASILVAGVLGLAGAAGAPAAPTKARALAVARAVNLSGADLPGFTGSPSHPSAAQQRFGARVARCAGGTGPGAALANVDSADFAKTSPGGIAEQDASSNVTVVRTPSLAAQDLRAVRGARGRSCLVASVNQLLRAMRTATVSFGPVSVAAADLRAPGSGGSFGLRFRSTAVASGVRLPFYIDTLGFRLGRAEIGLTTLGILTRFPAAEEQRLFSRLLARAKANRV